MGGCQNYGSLLGPPNISAVLYLGPQKGTIILTTTQPYMGGFQKVGGPFLGVLIIRIIVYWALFRGPAFLETPIWHHNIGTVTRSHSVFATTLQAGPESFRPCVQRVHAISPAKDLLSQRAQLWLNEAIP